MKFFEKDLRLKVTALLLLMVLLSSATLVGISYAVSTGILRGHIEESSLAATHLMSNLLSVAIERRFSRIQLLAGLPEFTRRDVLPEHRAAVLETFNVYWPIGQSALFTDTNGNPIAFTSNLAGVTHVGDMKWFKAALVSVVSFSLVENPQDLKRINSLSPVLAVSSPVRDKLGQIYGYVTAFTSVSDIKHALRGAYIGKTGKPFLIEKGGSVIAGELFSVTSRSGAGTGIPPEALNLITGGSAGVTTMAHGGARFLVSFAPVLSGAEKKIGIDWYTGLVMNQEAAFSPVNRLALYLLIICLAFLALGGLLSVFIGRNIARPILELSDVAKRIGDGDLSGEVPIRTCDQVGVLATSISRMHESLKEVLRDLSENSIRVSELAAEQSAGTDQVFKEIEEIFDSVVALTKNMDTLNQRLARLSDILDSLSSRIPEADVMDEIHETLNQCEILSEACSEKAVEIAAASQEQRSAAREVAAAARILSRMAAELKELSSKFVFRG